MTYTTVFRKADVGITIELHVVRNREERFVTGWIKMVETYPRYDVTYVRLEDEEDHDNQAKQLLDEGFEKTIDNR